MTTQELKDFVNTSDFSEATKAKALGLLEGKTEVSLELFSQLREMMEQELDTDFQEAGLSDVSTEPEVQALEGEYVKKLDDIEAELNTDMAYVESELKDLEDMRQKLVKVEDLMAAKAVKDSI
jgi:hypothetical protein